MISSSLASEITRRYSVGRLQDATRLAGGTWNDVYKIATDSGWYVLRVCHPETRVETVAYEHALTRFLRAQVSEVVAPLAARDGATFFPHEGRLAFLLPYVAGTLATRDSPGERSQAAGLLARLHRSALAFSAPVPEPVERSVGNYDWETHPDWQWTAIDRLLERGAAALAALSPPHPQAAIWSREITVRKEQIADTRTRTRGWLKDLKSRNPPLLSAATHGDFYPGNLLMADGRVSGIIDWEDARPDWLIYELGRAVWEFCRSHETASFDNPAATAFLQDYSAAGGVVPQGDFALLVEFVRCVRIQEVLVGLGAALRGAAWDPGYAVFNLRSLENLQGFRFET